MIHSKIILLSDALRGVLISSTIDAAGALASQRRAASRLTNRENIWMISIKYF